MVSGVFSCRLFSFGLHEHFLVLGANPKLRSSAETRLVLGCRTFFALILHVEGTQQQFAIIFRRQRHSHRHFVWFRFAGNDLRQHNRGEG